LKTYKILWNQFLDVDSCLNEASPLIQIDESELEEELSLLESQPIEFPVVPVADIEVKKDQTKALLLSS
jgi:hypothetical protein